MCKRILLDEWRAFHEEGWGADTHDIPPGSEIDLAKLSGGGGVVTDNCNGARAENRLLQKQVKQAAREKALADGVDPGEVEENILVFQTACHNHLRNTWFGAIVKTLSRYLSELLKSDLEAIDHRYRVSTTMDSVLRAVDKEFSLPANYPKGHGDWFKFWLKLNHPGALLVPVTRASGSRQDLACEGAVAVYWNRRYYIEFLDESLEAHNDNILQENLFIILTCMEMIALFRVMAILHFSVCMPLRFLAGNTHNIGAQGYDWSPISMGKALDALFDAMRVVEKDGSKLLDEDFMNDIFSEIDNGRPLEPLTEFMDYMFGKL